MPTDDGTARPRAIPQPGDTIEGKYTLIRVLGTGGMGVVYEAEHLRLKQRCAIKMLSPELLRETEILRRFEREARASALLKGPHVTRVTDVSTTGAGVPYIVMEMLVGRDLDAELTARGRLPYAEAVDYVLQACAAIAEAHAAGIIHRDLKPGNLFLSQEPDGTVLKVLDFGISKMIEEGSKLTRAGVSMGTALYMSPEQLRSAGTVDERSDIWSLGVILYELVCGAPPFTGTAPQIAVAIVSEDAPDIAVRAVIPAELAAAIQRTMERSAAKRFARVGELAAALAPFADPKSVGVTVTAQLARRSSTRNLRTTSERQSGREPVDVEAKTVAGEASTGVSHELDTEAHGPEARSRKRLVVVLAVIAVAGIGGFVAMRLRSPRATMAPPATAGSASVVVAGPETTASAMPSVATPPIVAAPGPSAQPSAASATTTPTPPASAKLPGARSRPAAPPSTGVTPTHPPPSAKPAGTPAPAAPPFL